MRGKLLPSIWAHDPLDDYVPARHRRACHYESFAPDPIAGWAPQLSGELAGVVTDAERMLAEMNGGSSSAALATLSRLLLRTEAIASSKIEGMQAGTRELARAEARRGAGGRIGPEARSIIAAIEAMQRAVGDAADTSTPLTVDHILRIHAVLMQDEAAWTEPGAIRAQQNWIGGNNFNPCGADYVPPPPGDVAHLLADLLRACADEALPAVVQAAIVHAQFETIHPFNDGNGRVGRALIQVLLHRRGLTPNVVPPISVVLAGQRDRYITALTRFRMGDVDAWIELFATAVARSAVLASRYLAKLGELREQWRAQLLASMRVPRADSAAWLLLDQLPAYPALTGATATTVIDRSKPAVNQAIQQLVDAGVLEPVSSGARNRIWEPVGLIDVITDLERGA